MRSLLATAALAVAAAGAPSPHATLQHLWARARRDVGAEGNPSAVFAAFMAQAQRYVSGVAAHAAKVATMSGRQFAPFSQPAIKSANHSYFPDNGDGFYAVVPEFITGVVPGATGGVTWSSGCLQSNLATAVWTGGSSGVTVNITSGALNPSAPGCSDFYLVGTVDTFELVTVTAAGTQTVNVPVTSTTWVAREGVRVFRFMHDPLTTISDALATISLFIPALTEATLDPASQATNLKFLKDYVNQTMEARGVDLIDMDWSYVGSGDIFVIQRLDGLGTMEQWGTGAASTHIVIAMRLGPNQDLFMVESTAKDAYWPLDNIQMNAVDTWIPMGQASKYAMVHLPLADSVRANFNAAAAEAFILNSIGLPYGYHNFIATFFDGDNNLPWPASWQFVEVAFNWLEGVDRNLTDQLLGLALNMRLGTTGLNLAAAADQAAARNMTVGQLIAMPEQDGWVYVDGPSMVCDVFACHVHKAAGTFGALADSINCAEFHNLDVYRLNIYNTTKQRPAACVAADPDLPYCQIMGQYRMHLGVGDGSAGDTLNNMAPYAHMNEHCGALPLGYQRTPSQQC